MKKLRTFVLTFQGDYSSYNNYLTSLKLKYLPNLWRSWSSRHWGRRRMGMRAPRRQVHQYGRLCANWKNGSYHLCRNDPLPETCTIFVISCTGSSVLDACLESIGWLDILLDQALLVRGNRFAAKDGTDEVKAHLESGTELEGGFTCLGQLLSSGIRDRSTNVISVALALGWGNALPIAYSVATLFSFHNHWVDPICTGLEALHKLATGISPLTSKSLVKSS